MSFYLSRLKAYLVWSDCYSYELSFSKDYKTRMYRHVSWETRQAVVFAKGYDSARYIMSELWDIPPDQIRITIVDLNSSKI